MWAGLFILLFAFATIMTLLYLAEEAVVFASAFAGATWSLMAFTEEIIVTSGASEIAFQLGGARWLLAGLGMLSMLVLLLDLFGAYRQDTPDIDPEAI